MKISLAIFDCVILLASMLIVLLSSILLYPLTPFSSTVYNIVAYRNPEIVDYIYKVMMKRIEEVT